MQTSTHASFGTPEEAAVALVSAIERGDERQLSRILGPETEGLLSSGDAVEDALHRKAFLERYREQHRFVAGGPADLILQVGAEAWPVPIPLVRTGDRWKFDGVAGVVELVRRRIGANELHTIDVMRGYVAAQEEYASQSHDGVGPGVYARRLRSDAGKQNGLYWDTQQNEPPSPAGPFLAGAAAEDYAQGEQGTPYHGYVYRPLHEQGPAANSGALKYLVDGKLMAGFALLARPAVYGESGVMTFIVNHDGVVWQRDLGADTSLLAAEIRTFNPDDAWTPVAPESGMAPR